MRNYLITKQNKEKFILIIIAVILNHFNRTKSKWYYYLRILSLIRANFIKVVRSITSFFRLFID